MVSGEGTLDTAGRLTEIWQSLCPMLPIPPMLVLVPVAAAPDVVVVGMGMLGSMMELEGAVGRTVAKSMMGWIPSLQRGARPERKPNGR
jgi:hypothetical protein